MNRSQVEEMFETANTEIMRNYGHERFDHDKAVELLDMMIDALWTSVTKSGGRPIWLAAMKHRLYKERKTMIRKWTVDGMRNARHARNS